MPKKRTRSASAGKSEQPFLMISNRNEDGDGLGIKLVDKPAFFECPADRDPTRFTSWKKVDAEAFRTSISALADSGVVA
jgi:hypothetical protein